MRCPSCNHDNRDAAKFCAGCAEPLAQQCSRCGASRRPDAKFCDECGLACSLLAAGDVDGAEARLAQASALAAAMPEARDLPPRIEETHAELARHRRDAIGCERALREAARMHRENGEEWLATQAETRITSPDGAA